MTLHRTQALRTGHFPTDGVCPADLFVSQCVVLTTCLLPTADLASCLVVRLHCIASAFASFGVVEGSKSSQIKSIRCEVSSVVGANHGSTY